jgi:hypothetical protein
LFSLKEICVQHSPNPMPKQACRDPEQLGKHGETRAPLAKTSDKKWTGAIHCFAYQPASDKTDVLQEFFRLAGLQSRPGVWMANLRLRDYYPSIAT